MRFESKLCHLTENKAVVQVNGWLNDKNMGSALAEGETVEVAEDKAISRLKKRLTGLTSTEASVSPIQEDKITKPVKVELPKNQKIENNGLINEPTDWSNELTEIDSEIRRLEWSRDDEIQFLEKTLGYNNRNRITNYSELLMYLGLLKKININNLSKEVNINRNSLIEETDKILRDLSWDYTKGRDYLQKEFNVSTRKELNQEQLISFVEKLRSIRNQYLATNPSQID
tara:strand:+ start:13417 stop:14103 length:687 start_codon:yes stop_codon:yes gene_type:complete